MVFHCYILIYCKLLIYFQTKYYLFPLFIITDVPLYIQTQYFCPLSYHKTSAPAAGSAYLHGSKYFSSMDLYSGVSLGNASSDHGFTATRTSFFS